MITRNSPEAIEDAERRVDRWIAARPTEERLVLARYYALFVHRELDQVRISELLVRVRDLEAQLAQKGNTPAGPAPWLTTIRDVKQEDLP
jgi:hypothetical protein